jgi:hypothetical protein
MDRGSSPPASDRGSSDGLAGALLGWAAGAYLLHAVLAIASGRHLFGDAAWFLVRIASEGRATSFVDDFLKQFHHSRTLSFWATQGPAVLALHLGLRDLQALSSVFGAGLFGYKLISIALCYRLLPRGEKIFFAFPALGLFAGTINSDVYLVSETHLAVSFAWPILIALHRLPRIGGLPAVICGLAIAATTLMHESFAFFATIMLALLASRWWKDGRPKDLGLFLLAALLALVVLVNLAGIAFPRDPINRAAFSSGLLKLVDAARHGIGAIHVGPLVSVLASAATLAVAFGADGSWKAGRAAVLVATCLFVALAPLAHFVVFVDRVVLEDAIDDRGFSGVAMQLLLMAGFLAVHALRREAFHRRAGAVVALLSSLVLGQTAWQMFATHLWRDAIADTRSRLATETGLLTCPGGPGGAVSMARARAERALCKWWITPLSIVLSPGARVRSLILSRHDPFQVFDPRDPAALPGLRHVSRDYRPYLASLEAARRLGPGEKVGFAEGGRGFGMVREGFSSPESWATWTDGERARIEVCGLAVRPEESVHLVFHVAPFSPPGSAPPEVGVLVAGEQRDTWRFAPGDRVVAREVLLPGAAIPSNGCVDLGFRMTGLRSPAALGLSEDSRRLGLAFVDLQRTGG